MLLTDAVTHEHDSNGAIGTDGDRASEAVAFGFHGVSRAIGAQRGGGGALRIVHEGGEAVVGDGEPTGTVRTSRFEIVRAGVGRGCEWFRACSKPPCCSERASLDTGHARVLRSRFGR